MKPLHVPNSPLGVTAGITDITGTAGGTETIAAVRFSHENIRIRAGQTVEWDNQAPIFPHTITFDSAVRRLFAPGFDRRDFR